MFFRYPGGKSKLKKHLFKSIRDAYVANGCSSYCEPFFGGGAIGIEFIKTHSPDVIWINDADVALAALWTSVIRHPEEIKKQVLSFVPSTKHFYSFKEALLKLVAFDDCQEFCSHFGFMKLAIHQISYSGLGPKSGSPLGGKEQKSKYKIDCRWSPQHINSRIDELHALLRNRVVRDMCTCMDFEQVVVGKSARFMIYLDPPYYVKGNQLYQHGFSENDHIRLSRSLKSGQFKWFLSYDDCDRIRELYSWAKLKPVTTDYSIANTRQEKADKARKKQQELLISVD